jgi:four helix bundle protein
MTELKTQLEISKRLGYLSTEEFRNLVRATSEVGRMLNGLRERLSRSP